LTLPSLLKRPTAYVPLLMSTAALAIVLLHIARFGVVREADEGTSAHLWQLLILLQMPIIAVFVARWIGRARSETLAILALQIGAVLVAVTPVLLLGL
jgi:hypothetical protein